MMKPGASCVNLGMFVAGLVAIWCKSGSPVFSQTTVQVSNPYIKLVAGVSGEVDDAGPGRKSTIDISGRWSVGTTGGDPLSDTDNNQALIAGYPDAWGAYTIVKIDELASVVYGDSSGAWIKSPSADIKNKVIADSWQHTATKILINRNMRLLRDLVRVEYTITNNDSKSHKVGIATNWDSQYGLSLGILPVNGGPYYSVLTGTIDTERSFTGAEIPEVMYGFNALPNYSYATELLLRGGDTTTPDKVLAVDALKTTGDFWTLTPVDGASILTDSAVLAFYNQTSLSPLRSRAAIVSYYGLGQCTEDVDYPLVLALQAPFSLTYTKASGDTIGTLEPDPFVIRGYAYNLSSELSLKDVQLQLTLGQGLEFASGESATKTIGNIAPDAEGVVTWDVRADGSEFGPVSFTVSVAGFPLTAKSVSRTVNIPATEERAFFDREWEMISIPFEPKNTDPAATFGLDAQVKPFTQPFEASFLTQFKAARLDSSTNTYSDVTAIEPGKGFWFMPYGDTYVALKNTYPVAESSTNPKLMYLGKGWNQVGNPYLYGLFWGRFRFLRTPEEGTVSVTEAVAKNWIRPTIYWYDINAQDYQYSSLLSTVVKPWNAYWLKVLQPVYIVFPPADTIGGGVTFSTVASMSPTSTVGASSPAAQALSKAVVNDWGIRLTARGVKQGIDRGNYAGCKEGASEYMDAWDADEPPACGNVSLCFLDEKTGERYAASYKPYSRIKNWVCEVKSSNIAQNVILAWDGLESLPMGSVVTLYDPAAKRTVFLRNGGTYKLKLNADEPRRLRLSISLSARRPR